MRATRALAAGPRLCAAATSKASLPGAGAGLWLLQQAARNRRRTSCVAWAGGKKQEDAAPARPAAGAAAAAAPVAESAPSHVAQPNGHSSGHAAASHSSQEQQQVATPPVEILDVPGGLAPVPPHQPWAWKVRDLCRGQRPFRPGPVFNAAVVRPPNSVSAAPTPHTLLPGCQGAERGGGDRAGLGAAVRDGGARGAGASGGRAGHAGPQGGFRVS